MGRRDGVYISIIVALIVVIITITIHPLDWKESDVKVSRDTAYVSSATLIGLATFGSVLGIKLGKSPEARIWNNRGVFTITCSVLILILLQWLIMLEACCLDSVLLGVGLLHVFTLACLVGIILGFVILLEPSLNPQPKRSTKPSP